MGIKIFSCYQVSCHLGWPWLVWFLNARALARSSDCLLALASRIFFLLQERLVPGLSLLFFDGLSENKTNYEINVSTGSMMTIKTWIQNAFLPFKFFNPCLMSIWVGIWTKRMSLEATKKSSNWRFRPTGSTNLTSLITTFMKPST